MPIHFFAGTSMFCIYDSGESKLRARLELYVEELGKVQIVVKHGNVKPMN
jgi:hypothetical protein